MDGVARAGEEQAQSSSSSSDLASGWRPCGFVFSPCKPKAEEEDASAAEKKPQQQPLRVVVRKPVSLCFDFGCFL